MEKIKKIDESHVQVVHRCFVSIFVWFKKEILSHGKLIFYTEEF